MGIRKKKSKTDPKLIIDYNFFYRYGFLYIIEQPGSIYSLTLKNWPKSNQN